MAILVYTNSRQQILLDSSPLATAGGEGSVHKVISGGYANCCAKIYHPAKRTALKRRKLEYMVQNRPNHLTGAQYIVCWPTEIVFDASGLFMGYIMPLAFSGSEKLYELTTKKSPRKPNFGWSKFDRATQLGIENRFKICLNVIVAVNTIHQTGRYAMVDYKPQNILITDVGKISILDVDSFQIASGTSVIHHAEVATPEYAPPEAQRLIPSTSYIPQTWDRFSLSVSIYEILLGLHPYAATCNGQYAEAATLGEKIKSGLFVHGSKKGYLTAIPPLHNYFLQLPFSVRNLFLKAFENGNLDPNERPSAEHWGGVIHNELVNRIGIKANPFGAR